MELRIFRVANKSSSRLVISENEEQAIDYFYRNTPTRTKNNVRIVADMTNDPYWVTQSVDMSTMLDKFISFAAIQHSLSQEQSKLIRGLPREPING